MKDEILEKVVWRSWVKEKEGTILLSQPTNKKAKKKKMILTQVEKMNTHQSFKMDNEVTTETWRISNISWTTSMRTKLLFLGTM